MAGYVADDYNVKYAGTSADFESPRQNRSEEEVFGDDERGHDIKYRTLSWPFVALLMITEIVSNGTYSLPSTAQAIGIVPNVILILFMGIFATYTAKLLVNFKLRHPNVHSMGDAGYVMFGPIGREILAFGTVAFAIFGTGSEYFAGYTALSSLSDGKLCTMLYVGIFAVATLVCSFPRTLDQISWLCILGFVSIFVSILVAMVGAGIHPVEPRTITIARGSDFATAFSAVLNPAFAYAGHFMFFILISEMYKPEDAMKAAYVLQGFATTVYVIFAIVLYYYVGDEKITSPALLNLDTKWQKAAFAIGIPNFLLAGGLYAHTASKLVFVRIFRKSRHLHSHTALGWGVWTALIILANGIAFVICVGIPVFNYIVGLTAALFAAWYTYGIAGAFFLHDTYYDFGGVEGWRRRPIQTAIAIFTILAGAFICVAGCYAIIKGIVTAYDTGAIMNAFSCSA